MVEIQSRNKMVKTSKQVEKTPREREREREREGSTSFVSGERNPFARTTQLHWSGGWSSGSGPKFAKLKQVDHHVH